MRLEYCLWFSVALVSLLGCDRVQPARDSPPSQEVAPTKAELKPPPPAPVHLNVGYLPLSPALPLFVAQERGMFSAANLEVELKKYQNGATLADDVVTGRIDAASPGPADVYLAKQLETPGRFAIYLQSAYTPDNFIYSVLVTRKSKLRELSQLKGKRIALFPGVTNIALFRMLLKKRFGWSSDAYTALGAAPQLQLTGLESGEYDALCPLEPTGTLGAAKDTLVMIEAGPIERDIINPLYITAHALSTDAAKRDPEALRRFVQTMERAVDAIQAEPEETRKLLAGYTNLTPEQAQKAPLGVFRKVQEADRAKFQQLADLLTAEGALKEKVDVSSLYF